MKKKKKTALSLEEKEKRQKMLFFEILNDEIFWLKYKKLEMSEHNIRILREYRTKLKIPNLKIISSFIEKYKIIFSDDRTEEEIFLDLF